MCGICGIISRAPLTPDDRRIAASIQAALAHRGPDGAGEHAHDHAHLAMRRLAIIDLEGGWQPLYNEDRSVAVICNGEVYNYLELRAELESRGHRFRTQGDVEAIAHAYEEWGIDFLHKLRGMYAIALHDTARRRVILARDRMGEKPLYLHQSDGQLVFSSELRAMLSGGVVPFRLDPAAVKLYFHYLYVPEPMTPVVGIRKLPAGSYLSIDLDTWHVTERPYWRLEDAPPIDAEPRRVIREELDRVAELVTRADVPVGVALSAGVDSSVVAALAARARPGRVHALTVGYPGTHRQDEREPARRWAAQLGMPFHDIEVSVGEFVELFPERAFWRDDPIADTAGHSYFAVSRLARAQGIPVLLMGQGGDELFWGYEWVRRAAQMTRAKQAGARPSRLRLLLDRLPRSLSPAALRAAVLRNVGLLYGYERIDPDAGEPPGRIIGYNASLEYMRGHFALPRILHPDFLRAAAHADPASPFDVPEPWGDPGVMLTAMICRTYLVENGMAQGDRLSMVNSVELRLPLSDYRLAEIAVGLRKARPDDHLPPKARFREAVDDLLPDWLLQRPKTGFTPPQRLWLQALTGAYRHALDAGYLASHNLLNPACLPLLKASHPRWSPWPDLFYRVLILEYWCRGMASISGADRSRSHAVPAIA